MLFESNKPVSLFAKVIGVERSNLHRWIKKYGSDFRGDGKPGCHEPVGLDDIVTLKREIEAIKDTLHHLRSIVKHSLSDKYKNEI